MTKPDDSKDSNEASAPKPRARRRASPGREQSTARPSTLVEVEREVVSLLRVMLGVVPELLAAVPKPAREKAMRTLGVLAQRASTGPVNAKRYHVETMLHAAWSRVP